MIRGSGVRRRRRPARDRKGPQGKLEHAHGGFLQRPIPCLARSKNGVNVSLLARSGRAPERAHEGQPGPVPHEDDVEDPVADPVGAESTECARLGARRAEDDAIDPGQDHRADAHRARLEGDEERDAAEPPPAELACRLGERVPARERELFRVGRDDERGDPVARQFLDG